MSPHGQCPAPGQGRDDHATHFDRTLKLSDTIHRLGQVKDAHWSPRGIRSMRTNLSLEEPLETLNPPRSIDPHLAETRRSSLMSKVPRRPRSL